MLREGVRSLPMPHDWLDEHLWLLRVPVYKVAEPL